MGIGGNQLDRLLPRHDAANSLELSWDVRVERSGRFKRHREEMSDRATIRDISLEGALIEVADTHVHEIGDRIAVRFRGLDGTAVIRHCRPSDDDMLLYGVRFLPNTAFTDAVDAAVGELRGHSSRAEHGLERRN